MKTVISAFLAFAILHLSFASTLGETAAPVPQTFPKPPPGYIPQQDGLGLAILVVSIVAFASGCILIYIKKTDHGDEYTPHVYVLMRSYDYVNYIGVCTNIAVCPQAVDGSKGLALFSDYKRDFCASYYVKDYGPWNP